MLTTILALPFIASYHVLRFPLERTGLFDAYSQLISLIPGKTGEYIRAAFYRSVLPVFGANSVVSFGVLLCDPDIEIGAGTYIGPHCNLGKCRILDDCLLGSGVHIISGRNQHYIEDTETPIRDQGGELAAIEIGNDCWLGNAAIVMADVGSKCVIGAGSVVTQPIESYSIAAGNPAKLIRKRVATGNLSAAVPK